MSDNRNAIQQERFAQLEAIQAQLIELQLSALGSPLPAQEIRSQLDQLYARQTEIRTRYAARIAILQQNEADICSQQQEDTRTSSHERARKK
jgi:hypothetical protein